MSELQGRKRTNEKRQKQVRDAVVSVPALPKGLHSEPKRNTYDAETRKKALEIYYSGVSGRGVGKLLSMSKANVYNWIKKNDADS